MTVRLMVDYIDESGDDTLMVVDLDLHRIPRIGEMLSFEQPPDKFGVLLLGVVGVTEAHYLVTGDGWHVSRRITEVSAEIAGLHVDRVETSLLRETFEIHNGKVVTGGGQET